MPDPNETASWPRLTLRELSERVSVGHVGPTGEFFCLPNEGVRIVRSQNIRPGRLLIDDCAWISTDFHLSHPKSQLRSGDILITRVGANAGDVCRVPDNVGDLHLSSAVFSRPKPEFSKWIELYLRSPEGQQELFATIVGSVSERINTRDAEKLKIPVPDIRTIRTITELFSALDDKIELNRKMNATLEAMARALFRDWFVDFGPTRAKMEARAPYLSPDLWSLFPNRLDAEGKPEGWEVSTIGDEVRVVGGSTPSTKEPDLWDGGINWATPKDLSNLAAPVLLETSRTISEAGLAKISSGLLPVGALLLSSRAPIGYLAIAEVPVAINQGFIGMICDKRVSNVFAWLWTLENMEAILAKANGSTFQEISKGNFRPLPVVVPSEPVLRAFDAIAKPLYDRIAKNERESRTLAQTRDLLLPRLMSGELRLAEVENLAREVA